MTEHWAMPLILCLAMLLMVGAGVAEPSEGGPAYGDPLYLPGADVAADPAVIKVGDTYYMYPTTTAVSIECWSSANLEQWTYEGVVWGPSEPGAWNDADVWAPDVFAYEGRYYLYYTANNRIGAAAADSPTGPFVDVYDHPFIGPGYGDTSFFTIDPHVFQDDDGRLYIYCTFYAPFSGIRVAEMDDPVTVTGEWEYLLKTQIASWEGLVNEAPWMIKRNGVYYLMFSGNGANLPLYAVGYATSADPMGPFVKYEGNPILSVDWARDFYGPGHNSVSYGPGGEMLMFYHTKKSGSVAWEREIRINELAFDEDGDLYVVLFENDDDDDQDDSDDEDEPYDYGSSQSDNEYDKGGCIG